jgi:hypothetical protein
MLNNNLKETIMSSIFGETLYGLVGQQVWLAKKSKDFSPQKVETRSVAPDSIIERKSHTFNFMVARSSQ